jgi:hypothetical protein
MDLAKDLDLLQHADVPIHIVHEVLHHPHALTQASALLGLGRKLRHFPEHRTNGWIDVLDAIIHLPHAPIEISDGKNLIHFCLGCMVEIGTPEANDYFVAQFDKLNDHDLNQINDMSSMFDNF